MKIGNIVPCPDHVNDYHLRGRRFVELYPETVRDLNMIGEVPIHRRTFAPTNEDTPNRYQSPRLVELGTAKRMGLF